MWHRIARLRWGLAAPAGVLLIGMVLSVLDPIAIQVLGNITVDQFQRWSPRTQGPQAVAVIDIDDESLRRLGQWPWPRDQVATFNTQLKKLSPAATAYDILWSEPDRQIANDAVLAASLAQGGAVIGFALQRAPSLPSNDAPVAPSLASAAMPKQHARYVIAGASPLNFLHGFESAVDALPALRTAVDGYGALTFMPDADGLIRRVPLLLRRDSEIVPSLAAEALRVALQTDNYVVRGSAAAGMTDLRIGKLVIPTTARGEIWVHYANDAMANRIPAWQIVAGQVPASALAGRVVLVGSSAQGLMDVRFTPLGGVMPGVAIHAQILEQILGNTALHRPGWAEAAELVTMTAASIGIGVIALISGALVSLAYVAMFAALLWGGAWLAFTQAGLLLEPALASIVVVAVYVAASVVQHVVSERRQRWIKAAFSRYISPNLVAYLIAHPDSLELGGRRQECSFVFTDLSGFTQMMEQIDPQQAVALLNGYLDQMTAITFAHQGTLDRIVGDAVAVMFSAPVLQADHRQRALDCALAMQRFSIGYVAQCRAQGVEFGRTRIGVHTGFVIVGNFGSSSMFDYRALGDVVNTASRLESANKYFGSWICVSAETFSGCKDVQARQIGRLFLAGKQVPITVFEPIDPLIDASADGTALNDYQQAYRWMEAADPRAVAAFIALQRQYPDDGLVRIHAQRLSAGQVGDVITLAEK